MSLNHISRYTELTDAHFAAIGRIVVEWSNIEFLLRTTLAHLLCTADFLARTYTDRLTAAKVQEALDEAIEIQRDRYQCRIVSESTLTEIARLNKKVAGLRGTRNKFAHFCWSRSSDDQIFGTRFSGGMPNLQREKRDCAVLTVAELESFYREAYATVDALQEIASRLPKLEEDGIGKKLT